MSIGRRNMDPELAKRVMEAAAAAKDEVLKQSTLDALMNTKPEDLIAPEDNPEVIKGNAKPSGGWISSPAMLEIFAAADKRLTRVAGWAGIQVKRVEKVHARLIPGTKLVVLKAAPGDDFKAIPVVRNGNNVTINLITLLSSPKNRLTIETGYRERFDINYIPEGSLHWPGLVLDLGDPQEREKISGGQDAGGSKEPSPTESL